MKITVAICTWNRSALLDKTLAQLCELKVPEVAQWELIVVDNNSTDNTKETIERYSGKLPIKYVIEPKQGLSHSRNAAIVNASGDIIIWTDDDVLVDADWLVEYFQNASLYPDAAYFGGTIDPWFESKPASWIVDNLAILGSAFAIRQLGQDVRYLRDEEDVYGANMCFRTSVLRNYSFDPKLGRVGNTLVSGDETSLLRRIRNDGYKGVWIGSAKVKHFIPNNRLSLKFIKSYYHGSGMTSQRECPIVSNDSTVLAVPKWLLRRYISARWGCFGFSISRNPRVVKEFLRASFTHGQIDEIRNALPVSSVLKGIAYRLIFSI